jgi:ethanolaminephosphotransferase
MAISGYFGPQIWNEPLADSFGYRELLGDVSPMDLWLPMIFITFFVAHLPACVINVVKARRKNGLPVAPVFLEWTPMILYCLGCSGWLGSPYSHLLEDERLVLFCLTMSLVFGRMTTKIILAHLTRQPFPYWTVMLLPLLGGAVLVNLPYLGYSQISTATEVWYLRSYFIFAVIVYFRWALLVIQSICEYLGINCLTIPSKSKINGVNGATKKMA